MRWLAHIQRSMLGVIFVLNGLNGFIHLRPPILFKTAVAQQYMAVMQATPYGHVLFALQLVCGVLLLARLFVPFALIVLAAYLFNIYMFHLFLDHTFSPLALIVTVLWGFTMSNYRSAFRSILIPRFPETLTNV
jgi:uncharacterized membrane protein YphA (DoxX/SURF4 family)